MNLGGKVMSKVFDVVALGELLVDKDTKGYLLYNVIEMDCQCQASKI